METPIKREIVDSLVAELGIEYDKLEDAIRRVFGRKGEAIVEANIKALAIGRAAQK